MFKQVIFNSLIKQFDKQYLSLQTTNLLNKKWEALRNMSKILFDINKMTPILNDELEEFRLHRIEEYAHNAIESQKAITELETILNFILDVRNGINKE